MNASPFERALSSLREGFSRATDFLARLSFWRFVGILTLVIICIYALVFFFAIFGAMSALR